MRDKNRGKFLENSRYVVGGDDTQETQPATTRKRKSRTGDNDESETEHDKKRSCTRVSQSVEVDPGNAVQQLATSCSDEPAETAEQWNSVDVEEHQPHPQERSEDWYQGDEDHLIPLFASIGDRGLALIKNTEWTSPQAVIQARRAGNAETGSINVYWYNAGISRHMDLDGNTVDDVVDDAAVHLYEAEECMPGDNDDDVLATQYASAHDAVPQSTHDDVWDAADSSLDAQGHENLQGFPSHVMYNAPTAASSGPYVPFSDPSHIGSYQTPSDSPKGDWRNQYGLAGFEESF